MVNRRLVDTTTGDYRDIDEGDSVRITSQKSIEYLKDTVEINKNEPFIKVYSKTLFEMSRSLSGTESQFINYLIHYIRYTSGVLAHSKDVKLTRQDMADETGLSLRSIDRMLDSLIAKQVIGKHKTGNDIYFTVNPFIFMKGDRVNETLYTFFKGTRWNKSHK